MISTSKQADRLMLVFSDNPSTVRTGWQSDPDPQCPTLCAVMKAAPVLKGKKHMIESVHGHLNSSSHSGAAHVTAQHVQLSITLSFKYGV